MGGRASVIAALLLAGCAANGAVPAGRDDPAALAHALAGFTPGTPMKCVPPGYGRLVATGYGPTLLYRDANSPIFRNDTTGGCERAGHGDVLVEHQLLDRACRGDIAETADPISRRPTGSCTLGAFVPYTRARAR